MRVWQGVEGGRRAEGGLLLVGRALVEYGRTGGSCRGLLAQVLSVFASPCHVHGAPPPHRVPCRHWHSTLDSQGFRSTARAYYSNLKIICRTIRGLLSAVYFSPFNRRSSQDGVCTADMQANLITWLLESASLLLQVELKVGSLVAVLAVLAFGLSSRRARASSWLARVYLPTYLIP